MIDFKLKLPPEEKDENGYTPSQNKEIEKVLTRPSPPKDTWKNFVKDNEEAVRKDEALKAAKAKEQKHLKELILFGLENSSEPVIKNPVMRAALEAKPKKPQPFKVVPKIKHTGPVKIDFKLDPMHTAGLWPSIKNSSIYKLLDNPQVLGTELGHETIIEIINLLQNSGLLKDGGIAKK